MKPFASQVIYCESTKEALGNPLTREGACVVIFQHEYGLVDFNSHLSGCETTLEVLSNLKAISDINSQARVAFLMHTVVTHDAGCVALNKQILLSGIPIFSTNREGALELGINYLELGCPWEMVQGQTLDSRKESAKKEDDSFIRPYENLADNEGSSGNLVVGAFGFLSANKDTASVINLCSTTGATLLANFAATDTKLTEWVKAHAANCNVRGRISFEFLSEPELVDLLGGCDILFLAQHELSHFSTSATARLGTALGKAVIVPPVRPFHDLSPGVVFAGGATAAKKVKAFMRNASILKSAKEAASIYAEDTKMSAVYIQLCEDLFTGSYWSGGQVNVFGAQSYPGWESRVDDSTQVPSLTNQNTLGWSRVGRALINGRLTRRGVRTLDRKSHFSEKNLILHQDITEWDSSMKRAASANKLRIWFAEFLKDTRLAYNLVEAALGERFLFKSIYEVMSAPRFVQCLFLALQCKLDLEVIMEFFDTAERVEEKMMNADSIYSEVKLWREITAKNSSLARNLSWSEVGLISQRERRGVVYPGLLLLEDVKDCIGIAYRVLLARHASPTDIAHYSKLNDLGQSRSEMIWEIFTSSEFKARDVDIDLSYSLSDWNSYEGVLRELKLAVDLLRPSEVMALSENRNLIWNSYKESIC